LSSVQRVHIEKQDTNNVSHQRLPVGLR
jgi:hypothetical protein